jgi:hypothetical protein
MGTRSESVKFRKCQVRVDDVTQLIPLLEGVPAVAGVVGRPRRRPDSLIADRGYDHDKYRRLVRKPHGGIHGGTTGRRNLG